MYDGSSHGKDKIYIKKRGEKTSTPSRNKKWADQKYRSDMRAVQGKN